MERIPTILLTIALLLVPLAIFVEKTEPSTWNQRLFLPNFEDEPNLHTPIHAAGTFLPPVISQDTILTPNDNPIVLTNTTRIEPDVTLTFQPGTHLFAHEWGTLDVSGTLNIGGTPNQPVVLTTNEAHADNQVWNGIFFRPASHSNINYAIFEHAAPALSCLNDSSVAYEKIRITHTSSEIYSENNTCPDYVRTF